MFLFSHICVCKYICSFSDFFVFFFKTNAQNTLEPIARADSIVQAQDFNIPAEAAAIHGIDTALSIRLGRPRYTVLSRQLLPLLKRADLIAAHNASFDIGVLRAELVLLQQLLLLLQQDSKMEEDGLGLLESLPVFCTMVETADIVQAKYMYVCL